jgi:thiamine pyrophosphate-dependent acetolactate synthase large subunit-like protein
VEVPPELDEVFAEARHRLHVDVVLRPPTDLDPAIVEAIDSAVRPVVLAGPGVVARASGSALRRPVDALRAFAERAGVGVLNTWGAKGVFDWRSRHHLATVGLQAWDFERGGLADADLIVTTGLDEREVLADWQLAPSVDVEPTSLAELVDRITPRDRSIVVPSLRAELAAVTQAGWERTEAPLPPTKVTQHYSQVLGDGGLVAADPGTAGYWVARTFATQQLGGAQVTAHRLHRGFAVACCTVARLADRDRPVLAVVDAIDEPTALALETAQRLGVTVPLEVWSDDGDDLDADAHLARLQALVHDGGQATVPTDPTQLDEMLAVAGPIIAWTR